MYTLGIKKGPVWLSGLCQWGGSDRNSIGGSDEIEADLRPALTSVNYGGNYVGPAEVGRRGTASMIRIKHLSTSCELVDSNAKCRGLPSLNGLNERSISLYCTHTTFHQLLYVAL